MKWCLRKPKGFKPYIERVRQKYTALGIDPVMTEILINRNIKYEDIEKLLKNPGDCLEDPTVIAGLTEAAAAINDIINEGYKIKIFADYDVDGLTAGYVMYSYISNFTSAVEVYYPERSEGYGLSMNFCKNLPEGSAVITVDNGISKTAEVTYCNSMGMPVVITDHHEAKGELPDTVICNPWLGEKGHHLCGAAVAWKICQQIDKLRNTDIAWQYTPYVAIGTIKDVMPITLENMAIIKVGLEMIGEEYTPSIQLLLKSQKITKCTVEDIDWKVGPLLNTCGRLGNIQLAKDFLFSRNKNNIIKHIAKMLEMNETKKAIVSKASKKALEQDYSHDAFCLFDVTEFGSGIAGLIANKLIEATGKPAIVYTKNSGSFWSGSVRTDGFNILPYLQHEKEVGNILDYGGHAEACGITLLPDVETFKQSLNAHIRIPLMDFETREEAVMIDAEIKLQDVTKKVYGAISELPIGKPPIFIIRNLIVTGWRTSSNNPDNLCISVMDNEEKVVQDYWAWGKSEVYKRLGEPYKIDILGTVNYGFGNNATKIVFDIKDIRAAEEVR